MFSNHIIMRIYTAVKEKIVSSTRARWIIGTRIPREVIIVAKDGKSISNGKE